MLQLLADAAGDVQRVEAAPDRAVELRRVGGVHVDTRLGLAVLSRLLLVDLDEGSEPRNSSSAMWARSERPDGMMKRGQFIGRSFR